LKYHQLKTWPPQWEQIFKGEKTFEIRENDRDFKPGDRLVLQEYAPDNGYTGRAVVRKVAVVVEGEWDLPPGVCVMSLLPAAATVYLW